MRIIGHGVDLVELDEIHRLVKNFENHFADRCFTATERAEADVSPDPFEYFAGRFAVKEAVMKAMGIGFGDGVSFTNVEVQRASSGAPVISLYGKASILASELGISNWFLSISHTRRTAIASVIATD